MHCPSGNATDPIWRVLASSDRISSWTPLKPQHSNPNPNPLANQLWCIDFLTPPTPLIIPHTPCLPWISYATQKLMLDSCKMVEKQSEAFHTFLWHFFLSLKQNFIAYRSFSHPDCIFEIPQLGQSGFSRVYSNSCCSCSFEREIIKICQSSHKMYSNNIVNFQESTTILNAHTKKVWKLIVCISYLICMYKEDIALNNLQWLICQPTKPKISILIYTTRSNFVFIQPLYISRMSQEFIFLKQSLTGLNSVFLLLGWLPYEA